MRKFKIMLPIPQPADVSSVHDLILKNIADHLTPLKTPFPLKMLTAALNINSLNISLSNIDTGLPGLPHNSIFTAIHTLNKPESRLFFALKKEDACLCINKALHVSSPSGNTDHTAAGLTSGRTGVLLFLADALAGDWLSAGGEKFEISGLLTEADQITDYMTPLWNAELKFSGPEINFSGWIIGDSKIIDTASVNFAEPVFNVEQLEWPVDFKMITGTTSLSIQETGSIKTGDAVTVDHLSYPAGSSINNQLILQNGSFLITALFTDDRHLTILDIVKTDNPRNIMNTDNTEITAIFNPASPDEKQMNITVQIEAGRIKLKLKEAMQLVPGQILHLDKPVTPRMALRAGDNLLGYGTLLNIDGELAIKIEEMP
jgi:flagellar motor switch/type III secretory pathway protein FliN